MRPNTPQEKAAMQRAALKLKQVMRQRFGSLNEFARLSDYPIADIYRLFRCDYNYNYFNQKMYALRTSVEALPGEERYIEDAERKALVACIQGPIADFCTRYGLAYQNVLNILHGKTKYKVPTYYAIEVAITKQKEYLKQFRS
jgi:hypothetical protein